MRTAAAAACTATVLLCLPPTQHVRGVAGSSGWSELHLRGGRSAFAPEHPTSRYRDQYVYGMAASGPSDTHGRQTFVREYDVLARLALEGSNAPGFAIQKTRGRPRGSKSLRRGHGKGKNDPSGGWEGQFQELLAFKQRHGHCVVPICRIDLCRRFLRCHDAEEQAGRESGGPLVNTSTDESGSAACPASGDTEDGKQLEHDKLARWVAAQRVFCKRGMLLGKRMARLDGLGFAWQVSPGRKRRHSNILARVSYPNVPTTLEDSALSVSWEDRFAQLVAFRHQHGHCNVPYKSAEHGELGRWVTTQRTFARYGLLRSERKEKLDEIQFVWDLHCTSWSEYYVLLLDFRKLCDSRGGRAPSEGPRSGFSGEAYEWEAARVPGRVLRIRLLVACEERPGVG